MSGTKFGIVRTLPMCARVMGSGTLCTCLGSGTKLEHFGEIWEVFMSFGMGWLVNHAAKYEEEERKLATGRYHRVRHPLSGEMVVQRKPKQNLPQCGAKTRKGTPCKMLAGANGRCRMHGGLSTGPKTPEGRARIAESNRRRAKVQSENS
jgi:hypothetical protein